MDICSGIDICGDVSACVCAFVAAGVGTFISCIDLAGVNCAAACCEGIIEGTSETLGSLFNMPAGASVARACQCTGDDSMVAAVAPAALACRYIGDGSMIADDHSVIVVVYPDTSPSSSSSGHACNKSCAGSAGVGADVGAAVAL